MKNRGFETPGHPNALGSASAWDGSLTSFDEFQFETEGGTGIIAKWVGRSGAILLSPIKTSWGS